MLIFTNSKDLYTTFIANPKWNVSDFTFVIVSDVLETDNSYNCFTIKQLVPNVSVSISIGEGDLSSSTMLYVNETLTSPYNDATIAVLVNRALNGERIIFVTSHLEDTQPVRFFDILQDYISGMYHIPTFTLKEYEREGDNIYKVSDEDYEYIKDILQKRIIANTDKAPDLPKVVDSIINADKIERENEIKRKKEKKEKKRRKKERKRLREMGMLNPFIE